MAGATPSSKSFQLGSPKFQLNRLVSFKKSKRNWLFLKRRFKLVSLVREPLNGFEGQRYDIQCSCNIYKSFPHHLYKSINSNNYFSGVPTTNQYTGYVFKSAKLHNAYKLSETNKHVEYTLKTMYFKFIYIFQHYRQFKWSKIKKYNEVKIKTTNQQNLLRDLTLSNPVKGFKKYFLKIIQYIIKSET